MNEYLLLACNWQDVINSIPCFCWGVLCVGTSLVALDLVLKYLVNPIIRYRYEENSKKNSFVREVYWAEKKMEKEIIEIFKPSTDKSLQEEIERLISLLEQKEKVLSEKEKDNENLKSRKDNFEKLLNSLTINVIGKNDNTDN